MNIRTKIEEVLLEHNASFQRHSVAEVVEAIINKLGLEEGVINDGFSVFSYWTTSLENVTASLTQKLENRG